MTFDGKAARNAVLTCGAIREVARASKQSAAKHRHGLSFQLTPLPPPETPGFPRPEQYTTLVTRACWVLMAVTLGGCRTAPEPAEDVVEQYTDELQVDDLTLGTGVIARPGMKLKVDYVGYFTSGAVFDTSVGRAPFVFELGARQVLKGWDRGLAGMRVGGKRRLVIPEHLAYGSRAVGPVPAHSRLIFEITLLSAD